MMSMRELLKEFSERRIWRVLIVYPGVTFGLLEAVKFFIDNYGLDQRWLTATLIASATLLPAAVLWNWRHGEKGKQQILRGEVLGYLTFALITVIGQGWYWRVAQQQAAGVVEREPARSVAVMPFINAGGDDVQFLSDGIAESLINWLSAIPDLRVISKSAAFRLRDQSEDTAALVRALGVDSILRGRLETQGSRLIVSASLVDTRDDTQLWGQRLIREQGEALYLEQSIVDAITQSLRLQVTDAADQARASGSTDDPEAYRRYLRGHHQIQATEREAIEEGLDELRAAIRLDPSFALPYADIADALSQMFYFGHVDGAHMGEARNAAHTAVGLAPSLAEAHMAMATVYQYFEFDTVATDEAFETAVSLSSQNPAPYIRYADYLWATGRWVRGSEMAARAVQIDPLSGSAMHAVGINAMFLGEFDQAARAFGEWNRFHPSNLWSYVKHATALALAGQCDRSLSQAEKVRQLSNNGLSLLADSWLAWSHKACGREVHYGKILSRLEADLAASPESMNAAHFYHFQLEGDAEALFQFLERWVDQKHPLSFAVRLAASEGMGWPASSELRADPRYWTLLESLGLPGLAEVVR